MDQEELKSIEDVKESLEDNMRDLEEYKANKVKLKEY
jgi:hypothetical protein